MTKIIEHDGDGKLYYTDSNNKVHWVVEVQTHEGDNVRDAINSLLQTHQVKEALKVCHESLCTYGKHPIIDALVEKALSNTTQQERPKEEGINKLKEAAIKLFDMVHQSDNIENKIKANDLYNSVINNDSEQLKQVEPEELDPQEFLQDWEKKNNPLYPSEMEWSRLKVNTFLKDYQAQKNINMNKQEFKFEDNAFKLIEEWGKPSEQVEEKALRRKSVIQKYCARPQGCLCDKDKCSKDGCTYWI